MLTDIIIELSGTKMGECNEIIYVKHMKLMMHMKATLQLKKSLWYYQS